MSGVLASEVAEITSKLTGDFIIPRRVCKYEWDGLLRTYPGLF